jgi:hypothetical protein
MKGLAGSIASRRRHLGMMITPATPMIDSAAAKFLAYAGTTGT